jgi:hypothetical protein
MRAIGITGLFVGAIVVAGCEERSAITAPSARPLMATAALVDRPYTWTLTCQGKSFLFAQWFWTENGVAIASGSASCAYDETVSGTGVRPANANGFTAEVGSNSKSWTFDPVVPFKASLSGSTGGGRCVFTCWPKESGKLTVDS